MQFGEFPGRPILHGGDVSGMFGIKDPPRNKNTTFDMSSSTRRSLLLLTFLNYRMLVVGIMLL